MMHEDLLGDINRFHNKFGFKKNEKVGIPDNNELVNFRTSFLMEELAEYTQAITKKDDAAALDALVDIVYIALGTAWLFNFAVLVLADAFVEGDRVVSEAKPLRLEDQIVNRGALGTLCHVRTIPACCSFKEQGVRYFGTTRRSFVFLAHDLSRGVCF